MPAASRSKSLPASSAVCLLPRLTTSFVCICSLLSLLLPAKSLAQEPATEDEVIRVSTDLLLFPIRIREKGEQVVKGLTQNELSLEDKDRVTTGLYFEPGGVVCTIDAPLPLAGALN